MSDEANTPSSPALVELIGRMHEGEQDLRQVADALGVSLPELAALADEPRFGRIAAALRLLGRCRVESFLSRYQVHAIARLVQLADQTEDPELARKAAVDLIKADLGEPRAGKASAAVPTDTPEALNTAQVLAQLERLGGAEAEH